MNSFPDKDVIPLMFGMNGHRRTVHAGKGLSRHKVSVPELRSAVIGDEVRLNDTLDDQLSAVAILVPQC